MSYIKNRIIHRFIRDIADYEVGGACYSQILPADTQVYAVYPEPKESTSDAVIVCVYLSLMVTVIGVAASAL